MPPLVLIFRLEEGMTCLREAASAEAGEIVQLQKKQAGKIHSSLILSWENKKRFTRIFRINRFLTQIT